MRRHGGTTDVGGGAGLRAKTGVAGCRWRWHDDVVRSEESLVLLEAATMVFEGQADGLGLREKQQRLVDGESAS